MRYLLDTGIWLRLSRQPDTLPESCLNLLRAEPKVGLSAVSLREVAWKAAHGNLELGQPTLVWFQAALTRQLAVLPLTPEIAADSAALPSFPVDDPYDQMIVATARLHGLTVVTTDRGRHYPHAKVLYYRPTKPALHEDATGEGAAS
jgi:PIN domain nuclease of toxin-antitoxin system